MVLEMCLNAADEQLRPSPFFLDGAFQSSPGIIAVTNPATEKTAGLVCAADGPAFETAIAAARSAFDHGEWALTGRDERARIVARMIELLSERRDALKDILVREVGCPRSSAAMWVQVDAALDGPREFIDFFLKLPEEEDGGLPVEARISSAGAVIQSIRRYVPIGVVAAISAYNFPLFLAMWKVVPALLAGNSVILRPSPLAPLTALAMAGAALEAGVPRGVFQVLPEMGDEGAVKLSTDPRVDMVGFTGSTRVGKLVMAQAAGSLKRLQLELGGKSAQIFLPDRADRAADAAAAVCTTLAGQGCALATRILVPNSHKAAVMEAAKQRLRAIAVGDPSDPAVTMGPVINASQRDRCEKYVALAVAAGAKIVTGGRRPAGLAKGYFFEPTLLDVPDNSNPAARDEIFGPVVTIAGYDTLDEAVRIANDSEFGLSGQVIGGDTRAAMAVARRIRAGTVNVNAGVMSSHISFGGWGASGMGRERGIDGARIYQNLQVVNFSA